MPPLPSLPLERAAGLLPDVVEGRLAGFVAPVVEPERARGWAARLEDGALEAHRVRVPPKLHPMGEQLRAFGGTMLHYRGRLDEYLGSVEPFESDCRAALGSADLRATVGSALAAFAGPRGAECPSARDGRRCAAYNVRRLGGGGGLPVHRDLATPWLDGLSALGVRVDPDRVLSYYLTLGQPESGAELVLYDAAEVRSWEGVSEADLRDVPSLTARVGEGEMVVFDSGRWLHSVRQVSGERPRWNAGGNLFLPAGAGPFLYLA